MEWNKENKKGCFGFDLCVVGIDNTCEIPAAWPQFLSTLPPDALPAFVTVNIAQSYMCIAKNDNRLQFIIAVI